MDAGESLWDPCILKGGWPPSPSFYFGDSQVGCVCMFEYVYYSPAVLTSFAVGLGDWTIFILGTLEGLVSTTLHGAAEEGFAGVTCHPPKVHTPGSIPTHATSFIFFGFFLCLFSLSFLTPLLLLRHHIRLWACFLYGKVVTVATGWGIPLAAEGVTAHGPLILLRPHCVWYIHELGLSSIKVQHGHGLRRWGLHLGLWTLVGWHVAPFAGLPSPVMRVYSPLVITHAQIVTPPVQRVSVTFCQLGLNMLALEWWWPPYAIIGWVEGAAHCGMSIIPVRCWGEWGKTQAIHCFTARLVVGLVEPVLWHATSHLWKNPMKSIRQSATSATVQIFMEIWMTII